jgi:hypothetical protein
MKTYFNAEERVRHLMIMACTNIANTLSQSNALTIEEKRSLKNAVKHLNNFNDALFVL